MRCGHRRRREPDIGRPHDLALAHRNAALDLGEVFADPDLDDELLDLAETAGRMHPLGIGRELADRFDIGREPGQAVGGALLAVEQPVDRVGVDAHALAHGSDRIRQQPLGHQGGFPGQREQLDPGVAAVALVTASAVSRRRSRDRTADVTPHYACSAQMQRRQGIFGRFAGSLGNRCGNINHFALS